jgi:hypothetical protein
MKKITVLCLTIFFAGAAAFANIAMPLQPPSPSGDVLAPPPGLDSLRIAREDLRLDLTGREDARSRARYEIANPTGTALGTDLYFVTPFMKEVTVTVDGASAALEAVTLERDRVPWAMGGEGYRWWPKGAALDAYRFRAEFGAGRTTVVEVVFRLPAGYDNTLADLGISPAAAAHALNWTKQGDHVAWYLYSLEPAATFKGGLGRLELEILVPAGTELRTNVAVSQDEERSGEGDDGAICYRGSFSQFPVPTIEAKVIRRGAYNFIGVTAAFGLTSDFASYTSFLSQLLLDVFFLNHQFSTGVEGNPFGTLVSLKIPVLYTFVFGERTSSYLPLFGDIRATAGVLIDLIPVPAAGFRLGVGARATAFLVEIAYDFYPFDPAVGYRHRVSLMLKLSL